MSICAAVRSVDISGKRSDAWRGFAVTHEAVAAIFSRDAVIVGVIVIVIVGVGVVHVVVER